jgi:hypothetical protein
MSYYDDHRVIAGITRKWYNSVNQINKTANVILEDDDGYEETFTVPVTFEVCGTCGGSGYHVNPSIDAHGISPDEFARDPDFFDDYRSGVYNQECNECGGNRVVPVLNEKSIKPDLLKRINDKIRWEGEYAREQAREAKYGY